MLDDKYLTALNEISSSQFDKKTWLINYFELYKSTLNWPKNLPPLNRSDLQNGTLRKKFNCVYFETLLKFEYNLNNQTQTLEIETD